MLSSTEIDFNQLANSKVFYDKMTKELRQDCLHTALDYKMCKQLTAYFIKNGADPFWQDQSRYIPFEKYILQHYRKINIHLSYKLLPPIERIVKIIQQAVSKKEMDILPMLQMLEEYGVFAKYPALLDSVERDILLHAIYDQSPEVVDFLLQHGVSLMANKNRWKLIWDIGLLKLHVSDKSTVYKKMAILLLNYLKLTAATLTSTHITDFFSSVPLAGEDKLEICNAIFFYQDKYQFSFSQHELLLVQQAQNNGIFAKELDYYASETNCIGKGTFGYVCRGSIYNKSDSSHTPVAIKFDFAKHDRLRQEFFILHELSHPNIIAVHGLHIVDSNTFGLIMEFANAGTLAAYVRDTNNSDEIVRNSILPWSIQITSAVGYLHDRDLLHRDLTPTNILLNKTNDGTLVAKIADFGSIGVTSEDCKDDVTTYVYCSFQRLQGHLYAKSDDVYSIGCLMGEMFTRTLPICDAVSKTRILDGHRKNRYPDFDGKEIASPFKEIVSECVDADAVKRPDCKMLSDKFNLFFKPAENKSAEIENHDLQLSALKI